MKILNKVVESTEKSVVDVFKNSFVREYEFTVTFNNTLRELVSRYICVLEFIEKYDKSVASSIQKVKTASNYDSLFECKNYQLYRVDLNFVKIHLLLDIDCVKDGITPIKHLNIKVFGPNSDSLLKAIIRHMNLNMERTMRYVDSKIVKPKLFIIDNYGEPIPQSDLPNKTFDSIIYPDVQIIRQGIERFINNKKSYLRYKKPYTYNILAYGTPGTGKTTLSTVLANVLNCNVYMVTPDSKIGHYVMFYLNDICRDNMAIMLFEEIDLFFSDNTDKSKSDTKLNFLLQYLSGQYSKNNVVNIFTTNYKDKLDERLIRSGRFDLYLQMDNLSYKYALDYLAKFDITDSNISEKILHAVVEDDGKYNPAKIESEAFKYIFGSGNKNPI